MIKRLGLIVAVLLFATQVFAANIMVEDILNNVYDSTNTALKATISGNADMQEISADSISIDVGGTIQTAIAPIAGSTIHTATTNANNYIYVDCYDNGSELPGIFFRKSDTDTIGTASQTDSLDTLGQIAARGVDNTNVFDYGAYSQIKQDGAAGVKVPSTWSFVTYSNTAANNDQLVLDGPTGFVGMGTNTPTVKLDVIGGVSGEALRFDGQTSSFDVATTTGPGLYASLDAAEAYHHLIFYDGQNWYRVSMDIVNMGLGK